jgi:hypothetical protein
MTAHPSGQPFGGYLFKLETDAQGHTYYVPDLTRPFFASAPAQIPAQPMEISAPPPPQLTRSAPELPAPANNGTNKQTSKPAGIGAWYVSRRTDTERGAAPLFDLLEEPERFTWFGDLAELDAEACARAWAGVCKFVVQTFPGCHALRSPWETGLTLIEHTLPWALNRSTPYRYLTLSDELRRQIVATSTQHRMEALTLPGLTIQRYVVYDARVAYSSHLRNLPVILADEDGAPSVTRDSVPVFEKWSQGRYLVELTVPRGWDHIGLAPRKAADGQRWEWPATPGESWTTWLDECELRLVDERAWPYTIRQRLLFADKRAPGNDPLREYGERIATELERIERYPQTPAMKAYRSAIRALALHPIGAWHKGSGNDRRHIDSLDELTPEDAAAEIVPDELGGWEVSNTRDLTPFRSRWWRPEMSSAVYARERVAATRKALSLPREALLGVRGDALHLRDFDPGWQDTHKVGSYRKQLDRPLTPRPAPVTRDGLADLRQEVGL